MRVTWTYITWRFPTVGNCIKSYIIYFLLKKKNVKIVKFFRYSRFVYTFRIQISSIFSLFYNLCFPYLSSKDRYPASGTLFDFAALNVLTYHQLQQTHRTQSTIRYPKVLLTTTIINSTKFESFKLNHSFLYVPSLTTVPFKTIPPFPTKSRYPQQSR